MKIAFWYLGKSTPTFVEHAVQEYEKRMKHYINYESLMLPTIKNAAKLSPEQLKKKEAELVLARLDTKDQLIVLDERGKEFRSIDFANQIEKWTHIYPTRLIFLVGGAFGTDTSLWDRALMKLSLGKGTYSHQIIRIMFLEQLYRAFTIIKGEKYHNE